MGQQTPSRPGRSAIYPSRGEARACIGGGGAAGNNDHLVGYRSYLLHGGGGREMAYAGEVTGRDPSVQRGRCIHKGG